MLVFGGNIYNDIFMSYGVKCFFLDFMVYDIVCDCWLVFFRFDFYYDVNRFGYLVVLYNSIMYVFGGFNSFFFSDILVFILEQCDGYWSEVVCLVVGFGIWCVWDIGLFQCILWVLVIDE